MSTIFKSDKILHHLDRVNNWMKGDNVFPITVELDATNICNHKCPGCCCGFDGSNESLSIEEMKSVIDQIAELGAKAITFTGGGEPLCNKDTPVAIEYARSRGLDVGLITNGSLTHAYSEHQLVDNCTWIRISLDAGSEEMYSRTHGMHHFDLVVNNIADLVGAKKGSPRNCTIGVGYLTGKNTDRYEDMVDFVDIAVNLEVDYAQFRPYLTRGKKDLSKFIPVDFNSLQKMSTDKTKILTSAHKYRSIRDNEGRSYAICYGHQFATVVCATGEMTICCHTRGERDFVLGSIKQKSISEIWSSDRRQNAIKNINLSKCPMYCRANTFNEILYSLNDDREHVNFL